MIPILTAMALSVLCAYSASRAFASKAMRSPRFEIVFVFVVLVLLTASWLEVGIQESLACWTHHRATNQFRALLGSNPSQDACRKSKDRDHL